MDFPVFPKTISNSDLKRLFPNTFLPRATDTNKGTFGTLEIFGGSVGMKGALILAGEAALKAGCGKVFLCFAQDKINLDYIVNAPELMIKSYQQALQSEHQATARIIGCGLGMHTLSQKILENMLIDANVPLVIDADALNMIATKRVTAKFDPSLHVFTPHPGEAARLLHCSISEIQQNRLASAKQIADDYQVTVVLKGHQTIVYSPVENLPYYNQTGNCGLSTAGTGDVLSGVIGSLLAQKIPFLEAIRGAVFLHGLAADLLVENHVGPIGLTASELANALRWSRNWLTYKV